MEIDYKAKLKLIAGYIGHQTDTSVIAADFKQYLLAFVPKEIKIQVYKEMMECEDPSCHVGCIITPADVGLKESDF